MTERTLAGKDKLTSTTLLSDQRGAVAFEMLIVWLFMMMSLLLPLADVAIAGFQYISAWQALRAFGQYIQYNRHLTSRTRQVGRQALLAKADPGFPISNIQLVCGDAERLSAPQATLLRPSTIHTRRPSPCRRWC